MEFIRETPILEALSDFFRFALDNMDPNERTTKTLIVSDISQ